jgi:hypothetical protein
VAETQCEEEALGSDPDEKKYQAKKANEALFRRLLKQIGDPALTADLERRKAAALSEGAVTTRDIPKPMSTPRSR